MRRAPARAVMAALAATLMLVSGCSFIGGIVETQQALEDAGYEDVSIDFDETAGSGVAVTVSYDSKARDLAAAQTEAREAARIVWREAPVRIAAVRVDGRQGFGGVIFTREELQAQFGPRPPDVDEQDFSDLGRSAIRIVAIVAVVGLLFLAVAVTVVVVLVRQGRRKRALSPAGWPPGQWQQPGQWPAQPGAPMWGQPQQPPTSPWAQQQPTPPPPRPAWGDPPPPAPPAAPPPAPPPEPDGAADDPWRAP